MGRAAAGHHLVVVGVQLDVSDEVVRFFASQSRLVTGSDDLLYYGDNLDVLRRHIRDETV
jgi:hypothetical protein